MTAPDTDAPLPARIAHAIAALPVAGLAPAIRSELAAGRDLVIEAPPGAGKTTAVPLMLLDAPWAAGGRILMLEPRRLAARASAARMAAMLGEPLGQTVGYRVRLDARVSAATRIEVVTEGIFTRRIQGDPELDGVAAVIFDEIHERSLDGDLGLALAIEVKQALRPDLRIIAMSATLDAGRVASLIGDATRLRADGRMFPVVVVNDDRRPEPRELAPAMAGAVRRMLAAETGDILAFLPGTGEIARTADLLAGAGGPGVDIMPLAGELTAEAQDLAIRPSVPGRRKVVLATAIAETSLTIDGVRVVIDGGYTRRPRFDPASGMSRLETLRVSRAEAEQRRGRAGRVAEGVCLRLWPEAETRALPAFAAPQITVDDPAPLALELAVWGVDQTTALAFADHPPAAAWAQARDLLRRLGALDAEGRVTAHGRAMAGLGMHPRLAHLAIEGARRGAAREAAVLAQILSERDLFRNARTDIDLARRMILVAEGRDPLRGGDGAVIDRGTLTRVREGARSLERRLPAARRDGRDPRPSLGQLVALAYPERLAQARGRDAVFRLMGGGGVALDPLDPLAAEPWLAVATTGGSGHGGDARAFLAARITLDEIETSFGADVRTVDRVEFDLKSGGLVALRERRLGQLLIGTKPLSKLAPEDHGHAVAEGVRSLGLDRLDWRDAALSLRHRIAFLARIDGPDAGWPDVSDAGLTATLEDWLGPDLGRVRRLDDLARIDVRAALLRLLDWRQRSRLDQAAPERVTVPSGRSHAVDYATDPPVLAVKLQEMFGAAEGPRVADGRVALLVHLLSPAGRPVQVTADLAGFWTGSYAQVRGELRGRYPKHPWPDDPTGAVATHRAKPRGS
ncbi:ATP-dependent helicase HrpB [Tistrella bauzanensis]|uniref:ATP-dependent helicase HrpB n=1 Tax=Tistrella bauzanensis TaxID=657419 RepID=A0ABQ1IMH6_9PROT|nr:ATP-dependent helicase HrpB [Tistrella bauzanensis]GGB43490.1 ATP-dependent helicase HrpB [Tistrella bauzanensis]